MRGNWGLVGGCVLIIGLSGVFSVRAMAEERIEFRPLRVQHDRNFNGLELELGRVADTNINLISIGHGVDVRILVNGKEVVIDWTSFTDAWPDWPVLGTDLNGKRFKRVDGVGQSIKLRLPYSVFEGVDGDAPLLIEIPYKYGTLFTSISRASALLSPRFTFQALTFDHWVGSRLCLRAYGDLLSMPAEYREDIHVSVGGRKDLLSWERGQRGKGGPIEVRDVNGKTLRLSAHAYQILCISTDLLAGVQGRTAVLEVTISKAVGSYTLRNKDFYRSYIPEGPRFECKLNRRSSDVPGWPGTGSSDSWNIGQSVTQNHSANLQFSYREAFPHRKFTVRMNDGPAFQGSGDQSALITWDVYDNQQLKTEKAEGRYSQVDRRPEVSFIFYIKKDRTDHSDYWYWLNCNVLRASK